MLFKFCVYHYYRLSPLIFSPLIRQMQTKRRDYVAKISSILSLGMERVRPVKKTTRVYRPRLHEI